jgi:hypothetical protein
MAFSATDVGPRIDLLLDGQGYIFDDTLDSGSVYSQHQRAELGLSPIFVERQNVQGNYGDNQQDFWLTFSQKDWSLGEQLRYARPNDDDSARRYWTGTNIDIRSLAGQASIREAVTTLTFAASVKCANGDAPNDVITVATTANLYTIDNAGTITDKGAHGLGVAPTTMTSDPSFTYISSTGGGTVGVRKYGAVFSTFSATGSDLLAYNNNTLYGYRAATNDLIRYDSAGAVTSLFTWKNADGTSLSNQVKRMVAFGGKLLIEVLGPEKYELWLYDGEAPSKIAETPANFAPSDLVVSEGTVFLPGVMIRKGNYKPAIWYYANGTDGLLWQASSYVSGINQATTACAFDGGLVFTDDSTLKLMFYDLANGGVHTLGSYSASGSSQASTLIGAGSFFVSQQGTTTGYLYPSASTATTATVITSLVDYDSSLDKLFRGIKVDFDSGTDGNGGTVDIAYRLNDVNSSYTTLQTGATSGTEYSLSGITGRSISVKVTLNKGTSTSAQC